MLQQREPITVKMVKQLEKTVLENPDDFHKYIAGTALFALFSRSRVGDLCKCNCDPMLDISQDGASGFVHVYLSQHKTRRPGDRRALPVVAPAFGTLGANWADAWVSARQRLGLNAAAAQTLIPAPLGDGSFSLAPMKTMEFAAAFRQILIDSKFPPGELHNVGASSLRVTTLSWLAKKGVDKDTRKGLGYHIQRGDRTLEAYSRDSQAGPLRILADMIKDVAAERFRPDETRSGQLDLRPSAQASSASSSARVFSSSEGPAPSEESRPNSVPEELLQQDSFLRNDRARRFHVKRAGGDLVCGLPLPAKYTIFDQLPADARFCSQCF